MAETKIFSVRLDDIYNALDISSFIVVNGMPSVGKTTMVKYLLEDYGYDEIVHSYVFGNSIATSTQLYNKIVENFAKNLPKSLNLMNKTIMGVRDFVDIIEDLIEQSKKCGLKVVVALDNIEYLKKTSALDCLTVLATIRDLKMVIVTCENASSVIENYFKILSIKASLQARMINIDIPSWSKEELKDEISKIKPQRCYELYEKFVNNVVQIFYQSNTRNFVELKTFCQQNFGKYLEHYESEFKRYVEENEPEYMDMSMDELKENVKLKPKYEMNIIKTFLESFKSMIKDRDVKAMTNLNVDRKVVLETSVLIVAAFIAANTKPSDDKINFVKLQKKRLKRDRKEDDSHNSLKQFTMERLTQIYRALMCIANSTQEELIPDSVQSDIQMLEDLKIISVASGDGLDKATKYQLSKDLEKDYVERLAKQLKINLKDFWGLNV